LPQAAQLTHAQVCVLFLPGVERGFADPELAAHIADRCPGVGLAQCVGDLLLGEFRPLHRSPPWRSGPSKPSPYSSFDLPSFSGPTSSWASDSGTIQVFTSNREANSPIMML